MEGEVEVEEDVGDGVGVVGDEVGGVGLEGKKTAVTGYTYINAVAVALAAGAADAEAAGGSNLAVIDEDIGGVVGVAGYKVGGLGMVGDITAVG